MQICKCYKITTLIITNQIVLAGYIKVIKQKNIFIELVKNVYLPI